MRGTHLCNSVATFSILWKGPRLIAESSPGPANKSLVAFAPYFLRRRTTPSRSPAGESGGRHVGFKTYSTRAAPKSRC